MQVHMYVCIIIHIDCLGCVVLLCKTLLASFFLPSSSLIHLSLPCILCTWGGKGRRVCVDERVVKQ